MTRMTGPDCVVMCNLINTYIHTYCGCAGGLLPVISSELFNANSHDDLISWVITYAMMAVDGLDEMHTVVTEGEGRLS